MPFFFVTVIPLKYADTATHWTNKNIDLIQQG